MKVYEKDLVNFTEIDDEQFELDFENGNITTYIVEEGKSAETIFNELKEQGENVAIHNGVYCKVVFNTYEAINPIPPIVKYVKV